MKAGGPFRVAWVRPASFASKTTAVSTIRTYIFRIDDSIGIHRIFYVRIYSLLPPAFVLDEDLLADWGKVL